MNLFLRFSLLLLLVFILWAAVYLATLGETVEGAPQDEQLPSNSKLEPANHAVDAEIVSQQQTNLPVSQAADNTFEKRHEEAKSLNNSQQNAVLLDSKVEAQMRELGKRNQQELEAVERQDGSVRLNLNGNYQTVIGAVIDENGELKMIEGAPASDEKPASDHEETKP